MKKILVVAIFFAACGGKKSTSTTETKNTPAIDTPKTTVSKAPENPIIGTPKKLGAIEIAATDFPNMMIWDEAVRECAALGTGWRLPTKEELATIYQHKDSIGGFDTGLYWNSEEIDQFIAGCQNFYNGKDGSFSRIYSCRTRAVRTF